MKLVESIKASLRRKEARKAFRESFKCNFEVSPFYASNYSSPSNIDLITVSFNAPKMVQYQIKLVKKFVKGNFRLIICDNSTDKDSAFEIKKICENEDITYIRVLDRSVPNGYSNSHAIALNWIYKNIVKQRKRDFVFLDHDLFPVKEVFVEEYLKERAAFGRTISNNKGLWHLWAGFSFFKWDFVKNKKLNFHRYKTLGFIKKHNVDTGSANWGPIFSKLDRAKVSCVDEIYEINGDNLVKNPEGDYEKGFNCFENGVWFHLLDGADRYNSRGDKISAALKYFDAIL